MEFIWDVETLEVLAGEWNMAQGRENRQQVCSQATYHVGDWNSERLSGDMPQFDPTWGARQLVSLPSNSNLHLVESCLWDANCPALPAWQCSGETCSVSQKKPPGRSRRCLLQKAFWHEWESEMLRRYGRGWQQLIHYQSLKGHCRQNFLLYNVF